MQIFKVMNEERGRVLVKGSETSGRQGTRKIGDKTRVMGGSEYDQNILNIYMKIS